MAILCFLLPAGVVKAEAGNFTEAMKLFSQTLELDPSHEAAKRHLEQAQLQLKSAQNSSSTGRNANSR